MTDTDLVRLVLDGIYEHEEWTSLSEPVRDMLDKSVPTLLTKLDEAQTEVARLEGELQESTLREKDLQGAIAEESAKVFRDENTRLETDLGVQRLMTRIVESSANAIADDRDALKSEVARLKKEEKSEVRL